jgi:hypothetical protein
MRRINRTAEAGDAPEMPALELQALRAAEDAIIEALARPLLAESTQEMRSGGVRAAAPSPATPPDRPEMTVDHTAPAADVGPLLALLERLARQERRPAAAAAKRKCEKERR